MISDTNAVLTCYVGLRCVVILSFRDSNRDYGNGKNWLNRMELIPRYYNSFQLFMIAGARYRSYENNRLVYLGTMTV